MKRISLTEQKNIQLSILRDVHSFCEQNGIHYTLIFGTLLGAIRHKGYIPWDDDIDIAMPRKDYDKFLQNFNSFHTFYKVYDCKQNEEYTHPYAKVADVRTIYFENVNMKPIGINIDVFPFDDLFETEEESDKFIQSLASIKRKFRLKLLKPSKKNKLWKRLAIKVLKLLVWNKNLKDLAISQQEVVSAIDCKNQLYSAILTDSSLRDCRKSMCPKHYFDEYVDVYFEGEKFKAIKEYHAWLTAMYGDYMLPPPEGQRMSPHTVQEVYWLE